jgi:hypothetical protein
MPGEGAETGCLRSVAPTGCGGRGEARRSPLLLVVWLRPDGRRGVLFNRRNPSEKRSVLLCGGCLTTPARTVWLGWAREKRYARL